MTPSNPDCIFCKIIAGQIPNHTLHEDDRLLAFLDIGPLSTGHALVIPKDHYERLEQMPADLAAACGGLLPALARAILKQTGAPAYNILQNNGAIAGQVVPHVHFHIIPRAAEDGLGYRWNPGAIDHQQAASLALAIRQSL